MEVSLSFCFVVLSTLLAIWLLKLFVSGGNTKPKKSLKPPGPWTLPIIGSLHHLISTLPHHKIRELSRRHGPVMSIKLGEVPVVVVSSAEAAELVLKTNDPLFGSRPSSPTMEIATRGGKGIVLAPYGERWRQVRKVCTVELLSAKQVKRMEGIRTKELGNLLRFITESSRDGATINVSDKVASLTNHLVTVGVFGGKFTRQDEYLHELDKTMELISGFALLDLFPSWWLLRWISNSERHVRRSCRRLEGMVADIVNERKAVRAASYSARSTDDEDLLDVLLRLQEEDSLAFTLTTEIIGAVLSDIFGAATHTTSSVLEWTMSELVNHPEAMSRAQLEVRKVLGEGRSVINNFDLAELPFIRMVIKETLRMHPPAPLLPRLTREDSKIMGYDLLEGTNVCINVFAISRDPKYWENPEEFKPERFENSNKDYYGTHFDFTPFGAGRRQCPGIQFSSSVMEVILANLLYHFDWMLPDGASIDMSEKFGLAVGKKHALKLKAIPYVVKSHAAEATQ
ncbi:desmethyl-deoxy-podophyllotoxin synthase [Lolium perenne]|uniref:desmethyl-deoxy-podophyllotoxin synthase n=1 Tax=Lolium perenne TaxID=4522 RepID=UPI0021EAA822|nr:desmethyl-deoxy-podophyllotoxin synthase-like [Lolium perenne]